MFWSRQWLWLSAGLLFAAGCALMEIVSTSAVDHHVRGNGYSRKGDYDESISSYSRAIDYFYLRRYDDA